jgi:hypothetical protein
MKVNLEVIFAMRGIRPGAVAVKMGPGVLNLRRNRFDTEINFGADAPIG